MATRWTVLVTLACCGTAAALPPSFRGLGRPAHAQLGVFVSGVTDDGGYAVGVYQEQSSLHPTVINSIGIAWRGSATELLPSSPGGVTPDGAYVFGSRVEVPSTFRSAWRWTAATNVTVMPPFPWALNSRAVGLTTDGRVLVGAVEGDPIVGAFLFSDGTIQTQIVAPSPRFFVPSGSSGDAGVIVGTFVSAAGELFPVFWRAGGFTVIGREDVRAEQVRVSRDGQVFTGTFQTTAGRRAFRATQDGGFAPLGLANFSQNAAGCISADGSVIGGTGWQPVEQRWRAILWTRAAGTRDLKSVLIQMGLQEVVPWRLTDVMAVSGDGAWLVGNGMNPAGLSEPWIARIPPFCYANCNSSTAAPALNVSDFTCFLSRFAAGDAYANCDGSTAAPVLNVLDFTCFLAAYAAGCAQ